jgi:hypothetical protein
MERVTYADMDREMGVFGDPKYCIARVRELQAEYGFDEFICYFNRGGLMDPALVKQSMTLLPRKSCRISDRSEPFCGGSGGTQR